MKPTIRPNRWLGLFVLIMLTACSAAAPAMPSPSPETPEPAATRATPQVDRPTAPASTPLSPTVTPTTDAAAGQATTAPAPAPSPVATASPPSAAVDCSMIELIDPDSATAQAIARDLIATQPTLAEQQSPPEVDEIRSITQVGDWVVFEARFKARTIGLEPAIFVLQATSDNGYRYMGLWSGMAEHAAQIRSSLAKEMPEAPPELFACLDLSAWIQQ